uniref:MIT domain-containing protein n=1 Tax=Hanusia phi TaxID=3032 RepID=A0A7S0H8P0_9CRYP|mmetsp:Transcript_11181/g.25356  ORF Transcript_11181/g.25356 Transcript_11181/m.25356 type:complete len:327 (+) Transcript_11181:77-1057(+)
MSEELKSRAKTLAREATEADQRGDHSNAVEKYSEVCLVLKQLLEEGGVSDRDKETLHKKLKQYEDRAAVLESKTFINALPDIPTDLDTPSDPLSKHVQKNEADASEAGIKDWEPSSTLPVVKAAGKEPSLASKSLENATAIISKAKELEEKYQITTKIGTTAVAAYESTRKLEEDYRISEKVIEGAKMTYESAKKLEEDYKVSEKVVDGFKSAAESARRVEEEYKVSEKLAEAASKAYYSAIELERQHQLRQKFVTALQEGWETMKDLSTQAMEYEREHNLSGRAKEAILEGCSVASEYMKQSVQYWRNGSPAMITQSSLPPNADV